jgi:predicted ATPase
LLDSEIKNVLIVCTYRNTDEGERIRNNISGGNNEVRGLLTSEIELGHLAPDAAIAMLQDILCSRDDDVQALCDFITQKTASNPYFICQFLERLHSCKLLKYSPKLSAWQFDLSKIQSEMDSSENVVDFVMEQIVSLSPLVQSVLQLASCLGSKFDGALLEDIVFSELSNPSEVSWLTSNPTLCMEYKTTDYRILLATAMKKGLVDTTGEPGQYRFTHDR